MPVSVKKMGGKWRIVGPDGNVEKNSSGKPVDGGGHSSKQDALAQMRAINMNTEGALMTNDERKQRIETIARYMKKKKKGEETVESDNEKKSYAQDDMVLPPKIIIVSDGSHESTRVFVQGMEVTPSSVDFYSREPYDANSEYEGDRKSHCSLSLTLDKNDGDFTKTVTMRLRSQAELDRLIALAGDLPPDVSSVVAKLLPKEE